MRPKVEDFDRPSSEIDERVRTVRSRSESLYYLDLELLRSLRPDVLITQDLCSVCSVTESEVASACASAGIRPKVLSLSPRTLDDVWTSIGEVGAAIGRVPQADLLVRQLRARASEAEGPDPRSRSKVAIVEWVDPPILAGLWANSLAEAAGGRSVGPGDGEVGERTTWREIDRRDPDLVVVSPCSFGIERTRRELLESPGARGWDRHVPPFGRWLADEAFFSRPGPRLADGVALIRGLLARTQPSVSLPFERWTGQETVS